MLSSSWKLVAVLMLVGCLSVGALADLTPYTSEADFVAALSSYYLEDFSAFSSGSVSSPLLRGPQNGFSYSISATNGLYSGGGNMSTNDAYDSLEVAFTGDPVNAIGGHFWPTDINLNENPGTVTLTFGDGASTVVTLTNPTSTEFYGFISSTPIASLSIDAPDSLALAWPTMDDFYVGTGTVVPAPGAFLLGSLGLGFAGWLRKRRGA